MGLHNFAVKPFLCVEFSEPEKYSGDSLTVFRVGGPASRKPSLHTLPLLANRASVPYSQGTHLLRREWAHFGSNHEVN